MSLVLNYAPIAKNAIFKVPYGHFVYSFFIVLGTEHCETKNRERR